MVSDLANHCLSGNFRFRKAAFGWQQLYFYDEKSRGELTADC
jgi:hypothetical protein